MFLYFLSGLVSKEPACNVGDLGSIPGLGRSPGEVKGYPLYCVCMDNIWDFPGGASGKEPTCQCKRHKRQGFNPLVGRIPRGRERLPTPVFWPREFHGLYSPWGHKESDMTE